MSAAVELWYLPAGFEYAAFKIAGAPATVPRCCRVFKCPEREMLSSELPELAAELLAMTNAPDWGARGLRPMRWGDSAVIKGNTCLYIPAADMKLAQDSVDVVDDVIPVPRWPDVAIAILRK